MEQELAADCELTVILMLPIINSYMDWKDFFKQKLTASEIFYLSGHRKDGKIEIEIYASHIPGFKTTIEVGYESPLCLVFLHILSPFTPGMNERQEQSYFHQNDFYPHSAQDQKGLEFDNFNLRGINEYLSQGFEGSETVYTRNGKPIKSVFKSNAFPRTDATCTIYFTKQKSIDTDNKEQMNDESYDKLVEIDLCSIYPGTDRS